MFPPIPYLFSFRSSCSWGTLSKAFARSRKTTSVGMELFLDFVQSWRVDRSCVTVDLPLRLANWCSINRRIFVYMFCLISIRALVSYWAIQWSAVNNDRALKDKFCQNIWIQYIKCILRNACLKTRIFTANVWLINYFATQLFCVFLKVNIVLNQRTLWVNSECNSEYV